MSVGISCSMALLTAKAQFLTASQETTVGSFEQKHKAVLLAAIYTVVIWEGWIHRLLFKMHLTGMGGEGSDSSLGVTGFIPSYAGGVGKELRKPNVWFTYSNMDKANRLGLNLMAHE